MVCGLIAQRVKNGDSKEDDEALGTELDNLCHAMASAAPRGLDGRSSVRPVLVFTDGACEEETTMGGYALFVCGASEMFGAVIPSNLADQWKSWSQQSQIIGQAELYPLLVARLTWAHRLRGQRVMFFVDNESIKAYSPVLASTKILAEISRFDYLHDVFPWYARVPRCLM